MLIVLESTTYPGTTDEVVQPMLEAGRLEGRHRLLPSRSRRSASIRATRPSRRTTCRKSSAGSRRCARSSRPSCTARRSRLSFPSAQTRVAEMVKLLENTFRAVNIGLVNELEGALRQDGHRRLGGDRRGEDQAVRLSGVLSRPRPRRPLHPDRSVLSHLDGEAARVRIRGSSSWPAKSTPACPPMSSAHGRQALAERRKSVNGSQVADRSAWPTSATSTTRANPPALSVMGLLLERGADVTYNDPHIPEVPPSMARRLSAPENGRSAMTRGTGRPMTASSSPPITPPTTTPGSSSTPT